MGVCRVQFVWDKEKAEKNKDKHDVRFEEAATVFGDPLSLTISDIAHSDSEERFVTIGRSSAESLLVVVHLDIDDDTIRLISARSATRKERRDYERKEK